MKAIFTKTYLFIAGLVMTLVGTYIAINTTEYMGAMLPSNTVPSVNMLSDLRGMGGMLLVLGIYVFISTFRKAWWQSALMVATAVYASFLIFRSLSLALDGLPEMTIIIAYFIEAALATLGILLIEEKGFGTATGKHLTTKH